MTKSPNRRSTIASGWMLLAAGAAGTAWLAGASPCARAADEPSASATTAAAANPAYPDDSILRSYPNLQKFLFAERKSNLYFGFGLSPMTIETNRIGFSANLFQIHYISDPWDVEVFSASFGTAFAQQSYANTRYFVLRTAPKYRVFKNISIGPVAGLEFVNFNNLNSQLNNNNFFTPTEPFSTWGYIYGANLSETFSLGQNHLLKINEIFYWENYPYQQSSDGWKYYFSNPGSPSSSPDPNQIKPGTVFVLEISFLL